MAVRSFPALLLALALTTPALAQSPSVGNTLVSSSFGTLNQLLDLSGSVLQTWNGSSSPASCAYLMDDGSILRPAFDPGGSFSGGGIGGRIQRIDETNTVVWDYYFSTSDHQQHHDIEPMPNGNLLLIAWERKTNAEAIAAGRQGIAGQIWPTLIVEVTPTGATSGIVVWEWHFWDHIIQDVDPGKPNFGVVADHPELLDVNFGPVAASGDWMHVNCIDYDPVYDQIVFSSRHLDEVYVIDHSTTTAEAGGHTGGNSGMGGDLLYRWGNPQAYDRGTAFDRWFFVVHSGNWIDPGHPGAGNILAFNNGNRPGGADDYSIVTEIVPPRNGFNFDIAPGEPFGPADPIWTYGEGREFYGGPFQCGSYRLPNGNTLITAASQSRIFEVSPSGVEVWDHVNGGGVNRALRYRDPASDVTIASLTPSVRIELLPSAPNPFRGSTRIGFVVGGNDRVDVALDVVSVMGKRVASLFEGAREPGPFGVAWDGRDDQGQHVAAGVYFVQLRSQGLSTTRRVVHVK